MIDFLDINISELRRGFQKKDFGVEEILGFYVERMEKINPDLNAILSFDKDEIDRKAKESQERYDAGVERKLEGVPVVIKDILNLQGTITTSGSKMLANYLAPYTATAVQRLIDEGAIILGKANMDEFAMGSSGENSAFGLTKNPWDLERVPGGSSSGSAASVASGMCIASLGTDTGGSIRQPASLCGLYGLKPTYGRVSRYGAMALGSSLDQIGPFARNVDDLAKIYEVIAGWDVKDSMTEKISVEEIDFSRTDRVAGLKIALVKELYEKADIELKTVLEDVVEKLKKNGCQVDEVSWSELEMSIPIYYIIQPSECSANLARYDGIRYGFGVEKDQIDSDLVSSNREKGFGDEVKRRIMLGTYSLSSGYYDDYFQKAAKARTILIEKAKKLFDQYDLLLGLTSPFTAFKIGEKVSDPLQMYLSDIMTVGVSLVGLPAINVPAGLVNGLPVGIQIVGKWFDEENILLIAKSLENEGIFCYKPEKYS